MHRRSLISLVSVGLVAACATGPKMVEIQNRVPQLPADKGRIWFYREVAALFGAGVQPSVRLNGAKVGDATPNGFFFVDVAAGDHEVATSTEVERRVTFTLAAGQERFVKLTVGLGVLVHRVIPELVEPATGRAAIMGLSYTGTAL
jgi:Protein of unknown function (DUF2846)